MLKYILILFFAIYVRSGYSDGDELNSNVSDIPVITRIEKRVPIEIDDDDDETDFIHTREVRNDIHSIVSCGLASSEPVSIDNISVNLDTLKYKVYDAMVTNISKCEIEHAKLNLETLELDIFLICPYLSLTGHYDVNGVLIVLPIYGNGNADINVEKVGLLLNTNVKKFTKKDETYIKIKSFTLKIDLIASVKYKMAGLYDGSEALSIAAHNYLNTNWRAVTEIIQEPVYIAVMKPVCKKINKCLKRIPIENLES